MNKFWVVALETYKKHVKSVSFVMMVVSPLLMLAFIAGSSYMGSKFDSANEIAVVSQAEGVSDSFMEQAKDSFDFDKDIVTEDEAKKALENEDIDGYLLVEESGDALTGQYIGTKTIGMTESQTIQVILNQMQLGLNSADLNLTTEQVTKLLAPAAFSERQVEFENGKMVDNKNDKFVMTMVGFVVLMAVYTIVMLYSTVTAQEVASEKGTRIMEVILSSTTAAKHFYGKITGIALVILTQVGIYLGTGIVAYFFMKDMSMVKSFVEDNSVGELLKGLLGYNLLYLLLGVLIYTILSAFTGSLVSKVEDVSKAVSPVMYIVFAGFFPCIMLGMSNPQSIVIKVMSYIPFLSSFAMPIRIANDNTTDMEVLISLGLLVLGIALLLKLSAKAYKSTVLIYSDKSMMNVFKDAMKFSK